MKSFPPPLTAEEERYYMQQYTLGSLEARNILIERNLRLVTHIIKKYQHLEEEPEDLISIGTIGLIKAITTFNSGKNTRLATYACRCIENEILMMLRTKKKTNRETSLYEPIGTDREGNEIQLFDIIESEAEDAFTTLQRKENSNRLYLTMKQVLSPREQQVLKMRYGLCGQQSYTQKEIAQKLGISRSYVSRIEKKAIEKLRPFLLM